MSDAKPEARLLVVEDEPNILGGLLDGGTPGAELVALLQEDADRYTWVAAAVGSNSAAGVQLATGEPVMAIGGFNGSDRPPPWSSSSSSRPRARSTTSSAG